MCNKTSDKHFGHIIGSSDATALFNSQLIQCVFDMKIKELSNKIWSRKIGIIINVK